MAIMFKKTAVILFLLSQVITVSGSNSKKKDGPFKTIKRTPKPRVENPNSSKTTTTIPLRKSKTRNSPLGSSPLGISELTLSNSKTSADGVVEVEKEQNRNEVKLVRFVEEEIDSFDFALFDFKEVPTKPVIDSLIEAITSGDLISVRCLMSKEVNLNSLEKGSRTPFMLAIQTGNLAMADALLSTGRVDPNILATDGCDVLSLAARHLGLEFMLKIISGPIQLTNLTVFTIICDLRKNNDSLFYPMIAAMVKTRNPNVMSAIIVMTKDAVILNDIGFVRFAYIVGVPLDKSYRGVYFIHFAAIRGYTEMVKFLVQSGTPVDILTETTQISALESAYSHKNSAVAVELIKMGASHGLDRCIFNAILDNNIPIIHALVSTYPDLNFILKFENGLNPITLAISADKPEILQLILQSGTINPIIYDSLGNNIYNIEVDENASEELKTIIQRERNDAADLFGFII